MEKQTQSTKAQQGRIVITVVGKDTVGIIAKVATFLAEGNINILDLSQGTTQGYFNMIIIADMAASPLTFAQVQEGLSAVGAPLGQTIHAQREEIFEMMHRI